MCSLFFNEDQKLYVPFIYVSGKMFGELTSDTTPKEEERIPSPQPRPASPVKVSPPPSPMKVRLLYFSVVLSANSCFLESLSQFFKYCRNEGMEIFLVALC